MANRTFARGAVRGPREIADLVGLKLIIRRREKK